MTFLPLFFENYELFSTFWEHCFTSPCWALIVPFFAFFYLDVALYSLPDDRLSFSFDNEESLFNYFDADLLFSINSEVDFMLNSLTTVFF